MQSWPFTIVLGSSSPRRKELLSYIAKDFSILAPSDFVEKAEPGENPSDYVVRNAKGKALAVKSVLLKATSDHVALICADTVVVFRDEIIEKPTDRDDAFSILSKLSGQKHEVMSGVCLMFVESGSLKILNTKTELVKTMVQFRSLDEDDITSYIATGEPMDKSGAYAMQGIGSFMVAKISGSPTNVIGLPLPMVHSWLKAMKEKYSYFNPR